VEHRDATVLHSGGVGRGEANLEDGRGARPRAARGTGPLGSDLDPGQRVSPPPDATAARPASSRAIGIRNGEQDT